MSQGGFDGSLGRRLSRWLAWQSLIGLALVSAIVYAVTSAALVSRQGILLEQKQVQLRHLLTDSAVAPDKTTSTAPAPTTAPTPAPAPTTAGAPAATPVLASTSLAHRLDDYLMGHPDLALTLQGPDGALVYERNFPTGVADPRTRRFVVDTAAGTAGTSTIEGILRLDTQVDRELLSVIGLTLVASAIGGAIVVSAGGYLLVRMGLRPVQQLVDQTRALTASTLHRKLDGASQPTELSPLVEQFNRLLERLDGAYEQLESFNADVAHELAAPLSTLILSSENALRKSRDIESLREVLRANLEDLHRLAGIVRDMLFLSQADRGALARRAPVESLARVARLVADFHEAGAGDAGLAIAVHGDAAGDLDVALIQRALSNLLGNALRFARPESTIGICIQARGEWIDLTVRNEGPAVAAEHLARLFDRFYREDLARAEADQHHGLGLAIVAAIARMHGGRTQAASDQAGTRIGLVLRATAERAA